MAVRSTSKKVRYAVVGLGHIAQVAILPAFKNARNSELVAVVSDDPKKREAMGKKYELEKTYSYEQYDEALVNCDAVYIALPNHLHREYAVRAANAKVHVLCEKPMAVTADECESMIHAAVGNDVKLMIAYRLHFEQGNLEVVRLIKEEKLGKVRIFTSEFAQQVVEGNVRITEPVEKGGGPVYDMGVYCINAARYLLQEEPTEVFAFSANNGDKRFAQTDEMTSVTMRFPGERLASFTCSFGATDVSHYSVIGTEGILIANPAYDYSIPIKHELTVGEKATRRTFRKRDQFAAELIYFSTCVLQNKEPEPSGQEGLADVRIVEAIYESARTGRVVELPNMPSKKRPTPEQEIHRPAHGKPEIIHAKSASGE